MSSQQPLASMVRKLRQRARLDEHDCEAILALPYALRAVEPGQYIVRQSDRALQCCLLNSGFAYRHKIIGNGDRQIVSIHMRGDVLDLQNSLLDIADHSVQPLTIADVAFIPSEAIVELARAFPAVAHAMWLDTLVDGSVFREWIANVGRRDARARISHLLCEFGIRLEDAGLSQRTSYSLPMTQEQVADATGLTPVHVNRTLMSLEADGLIEREKRALTIPDWRKLQEVGDFDSTYLHRDLMDAHPSN